ncbi:MAG: DUF4097 family beta strand repeat-containing protein [Acholeplasmataceae bacterium]|nr:DUF4097 family beta strand repeat-containing protein [Acholeplasmataceae bacterium]
MKKFLEDLKIELEKKGISESDIADIISDHREMIEQAFEQGLSDEDITSRFGFPKDIANELSNDQNDEEVENDEMPLEQHMIFKLEHKTYDVDINLIDEDILIEPSKDNDIHVISEEKMDDDKYIIKFKNNKLKLYLKPKENKNYYSEHKNNSNEFKIYLPLDGEINLVSVKLISGDLKYHKLNAKSLTTNNISGDQEIEEIHAHHVKINTVSGDIELANIEADTFFSSLVSGDMEMDHVKVSDEMMLNTVSGDFDIHDATCEHLELHTVSGDIDGKEVYPKKIKLTSVSGDINIDNQNQTAIEIIKKSSLSGDININI